MDTEAMEAVRRLAQEAVAQATLRIQAEGAGRNLASGPPFDTVCSPSCTDSSINSAPAADGSSVAAAAVASIDQYAAAAAAMGDDEGYRFQMHDILINAFTDNSFYCSRDGLSNTGGSEWQRPISPDAPPDFEWQEAPPDFGDFGHWSLTAPGDGDSVIHAANSAAAAAADTMSDDASTILELPYENTQVLQAHARNALVHATITGSLPETLDAVFAAQFSTDAAAPERVAEVGDSETTAPAEQQLQPPNMHRDALRSTLLQASHDGRLHDALIALRARAMEEAANAGMEARQYASAAVDEARRRAQHFFATILEMTSGCSCTICMESLELTQDLGLLPCTHAFHCECVEMWLTSRRTCPNCRAPVGLVAQDGLEAAVVL